MSDLLYTVGKIVNTHGLKGELKILSQTDFPDIRFKPKSKLVMQSPDMKTTVPVEVESAREHKNVFIVKFKQYADINQVEQYKGWMLKVSERDLVELDEDEYYYHEIVGCTVVTDEGEELGTITEILTPGANHVWTVTRPNGKQVLIPVIDDVVLNVDVANKKVLIHLMEGLL